MSKGQIDILLYYVEDGGGHKQEERAYADSFEMAYEIACGWARVISSVRADQDEYRVYLHFPLERGGAYATLRVYATGDLRPEKVGR